MHRSLPYLTAGLLAAAHGCSLVIGDIPPAGSGQSDVPSGGQAGTSTNSGIGAGGDAGAPNPSAGSGGTESNGGTTGSTQGGTGNDGGQAGATPTSDGGDGGTGGNAMSTVSGGGGSGGSGAATSGGGTGGCVEECDCDGDDALSEACAGDDCDDHNDRVFPGQTLFFNESTGTVGFDYNCDDQSEREFGEAVDCAGLSLGGCDDVGEGFLGSLPACGNSGAWGACTAGTLACMDDEIDTRVMRCR